MKKKLFPISSRRVRQKPRYKLGQIVRSADNKKVFSKRDSTNYGYNLYRIIKVLHNTKPSYRIEYLPERYDENLLLPTKLSFDENNKVMMELNLIQQYNKERKQLSEDEKTEKCAKNTWTLLMKYLTTIQIYIYLLFIWI